MVLPLLLEDHVQALQHGVVLPRVARAVGRDAVPLQVLGLRAGDHVAYLVHALPAQIEHLAAGYFFGGADGGAVGGFVGWALRWALAAAAAASACAACAASCGVIQVSMGPRAARHTLPWWPPP